MRKIALDNSPNQSFSVRLDDNFYLITLKETNGVMSVTIIRNDIPIISNLRIVAGTPLLPYRYQESGNFMILTLNDDLPSYTEFGVSQTLIYASQEELDEIRSQAILEVSHAGA